MTLEELCILGMARTSEVTSAYPSTRSLMYRRVGIRQRELMAMAAQVNPDYYGVCAISELDDDAATDLNDIIEPVPTPELIERVEVKDVGDSDWETGTEIHIVALRDTGAELAPRATLRDLVLQGVGGATGDLEGVASVEIYYARLAAMFGATDGSTQIELQTPWDELLILDLARWLLGKATSLEPAVRDKAIAELTGEEKGHLANYLTHVREFAPAVSRFVRPLTR